MPSKKQLYIFAVFFVLYEMNCYLSNDMIMPAMITVVNEYNASVNNIALSLSLYIAGGSTLQIFLGPVADLIGKRKIMLGGNILFLVATLLIPFSHTIDQFLLARFFQGMGLCFIFIGYAMIHEYFNDIEAVKVTAILANVAIFAPLVGPVIGSGITTVSHWEFVFIISGILGVISLYGLFKYMPQGQITQKRIDVGQIVKSYKLIFSNKTFMFGIFINGIAVLPIIAWIGLSPTIILDKMRESFTVYIVYQSVIFGGFIVSSTAMQKIAGRFSFKFIIKGGGTIAILGLIVAAVFHMYGTLFIMGMFIYAFGFGVCNGVITRIALMSTGQSGSLSSSAFSLLNGLYLSSGLEIYSIVCAKFDYSLASYAIFNLLFGVIVYLCALKFGKMNEGREWKKTVHSPEH